MNLLEQREVARRLEEAIVAANAATATRSIEHLEQQLDLLFSLPFQVVHEPSMFALERRAAEQIRSIIQWAQEHALVSHTRWLQLMGHLDPDTIIATIRGHRSDSTVWRHASLLCHALLMTPPARVTIAHVLFEDDTLWPVEFTPLMRLNQRKCWAQALGVWDFRPSHPMVGINSNERLQELLRGAAVAPLLTTLEALEQCLTVPGERLKQRDMTDLDALISILAQAHKWSTDTSEVLYLSATVSANFLSWLGRDHARETWSANGGLASARANFPPRDASFPHIDAFFKAPSSTTVLIMPVHAPGHYTLAAFWWDTSSSRRILNSAFFDSFHWHQSTSPAYERVFRPFVTRLAEVWSLAINKPVVTFGNQSVTQRDNECGALTLYGMDRLCCQSDTSGRARIEAYASAYSGLELSDAAADWASALTPLGGWGLQVMFLRGLRSLYEQCSAEEKKNPALPLLANWTQAINQSGVLVQQQLVVDAQLADDLLLDTYLAPWEASLTTPFINNMTVRAEVQDAYSKGQRHFTENDNEYWTADFISAVPWSPMSETSAALLALTLLTFDRGGTLLYYSAAWLKHFLFFPAWPATPSARMVLQVQLFWSAFAAYIPLLLSLPPTRRQDLATLLNETLASLEESMTQNVNALQRARAEVSVFVEQLHVTARQLCEAVGATEVEAARVIELFPDAKWDSVPEVVSLRAEWNALRSEQQAQLEQLLTRAERERATKRDLFTSA